MTNPRWTHRPEGSTWGDFGPDDQLGRLNLITPEKVRQGVAEVVEGRTFCLSLPLDYPGGNGLNPRRFPPVLRPTELKGQPFFNREIPGHSDVICDDLVVMHLQYSTQWDSLAHVGGMFDVDGSGQPRAVYYNGFRAGQDVQGDGDSSAALKLGIENMATHGVQGRAVMIDLRHHYGDAFRHIGHDDLMRVIDSDGIEIQPGDMVCLHTGFADVILGMNRQPDHDTLHKSCCVLDGRDTRLLNWITDSGLAALIADNYAVEAHPAKPGADCCALLPLHEHCLFKLGVHLGELWHLTPLARHLRAAGRSRFLLTAPPLRLPGAVGSPATPVATV
ncbi:cyclase family protein [Thalassovita sp.]|uniref:cyclase family protein n=1 Tax=Thalassovita sp. TaxID=1979401 RepID=UPI0029DE6B44|nr:cyclase family protein [Thalassovita sp.]